MRCVCSSGTIDHQPVGRGSQAGVAEVRMPEFSFVDFFRENRARIQGGLGANDVDNGLRQSFEQREEGLVMGQFSM